MGAAVGREEEEEEVPERGPLAAGHAWRQQPHSLVQWQAVARNKRRVPRAGNAWLFNESFGGDIDDAKKQAAAVGGAHFTKYDSWLQVVGNDSYVESASDPSAVLFSQASAAWTPLGASLYNVDRGGVLRSHGQEDTPTSIISNVPATAVSFRVTDNEVQRSLGLAIGTSGSAHSHFTLIGEVDRSVYAGNALYGWDVKACGSSCDGDVLTIEHTGSEIIFWRNNEVLHALMFSLTPGEQFYAYANIAQAGGEMREVTYVPLPVKPSLSFRMYRFTPTRMRSSSATAVHISELKFRQQGPPGSIVDMRHAIASNPGGHNPASHGPERAIDGMNGTKWVDLNRGSLVIEFPSSMYKKVRVDEFCFSTGDDNEDRDPVQWRLEGSVTGAEWTPLHVQSHFFDTPRERRAQTPWFPFNTFDIPQEEPTASPVEEAAPCFVTRAAFEANLRGVSCLSWQEFNLAAATGPDFARPALPGSELLSILTSLGTYSLNLLIWCLLAMMGTHHSPMLGLAATLVYGFVLRALLASGMDFGKQPAASAGGKSRARPWRSWPWARRRNGLKQD